MPSLKLMTKQQAVSLKSDSRGGMMACKPVLEPTHRQESPLVGFVAIPSTANSFKDANLQKRLDFCLQNRNDPQDNVIFTNESTVPLCIFTCRQFHKAGQPPKRCPKPKHPLQLYIWAGISRCGPAEIVILEGIMDGLPFIRDVMPDHQFMQDNDPKHTSKRAKAFYDKFSINWWHTPAESPGLNPIENL